MSCSTALFSLAIQRALVVNARMIVEALAVVRDGFDLGDGRVDFIEGVLFLVVELRRYRGAAT